MFISETKASKLTDIPERTLQTWRVRGGGPPYYKVGRSVKYDDVELEAWVRAGRALSTTDADMRAINKREAAAAAPAAEKDEGRARGEPLKLLSPEKTAP